MAPIGTVIKNGLLFLILLIPVAYLSSFLFASALIDLNFAATADDGSALTKDDIGSDDTQRDFFNIAVQEFTLSILLLFGVGGLLFMKSLSDSVEDGMVEF